jgi:hypothetical protein
MDGDGINEKGIKAIGAGDMVLTAASAYVLYEQ